MEKKMFLDANWKIFDNATKLRSNMTHSETLLWEYLRTKPLNCKFRRQHPISIYIADFYCHSLKLVIEVDGDIHKNRDVALNDETRQKHLESESISFLRFTNDEVENDFDKVIKKIEHYITTREKPL